jgi:hypothetical protein
MTSKKATHTLDGDPRVPRRTIWERVERVERMSDVLRRQRCKSLGWPGDARMLRKLVWLVVMPVFVVTGSVGCATGEERSTWPFEFGSRSPRRVPPSPSFWQAIPWGSTRTAFSTPVGGRCFRSSSDLEWRSTTTPLPLRPVLPVRAKLEGC